MAIEPLSHETLVQAMELLNSVFQHQPPGDESDLWLPTSLNFSEVKVPNVSQDWIMYWVAKKDRRVNGVIGLYNDDDDLDIAYWLSWFCVDSAFRNYGVGSRLVDFPINKTKTDGKKYLRLVSYVHPDNKYDAATQIFYDKRGFVVTNTCQVDGFKEVYRELKLK